jgi:hypothetical protein
MEILADCRAYHYPDQENKSQKKIIWSVLNYATPITSVNQVSQLCCEYNMTWQDCITSVNLLAQGIDIT